LKPSRIEVHKIIPCAEDDGVTKEIQGKITGLEFQNLKTAKMNWSPALFIAGHCVVYKRGRSVLIISANGAFSATKLINVESGIELLEDLVVVYVDD
jgi:hypothetical protein